MHEPLLERIDQLERSVRRWRLACFALAVLVVSLLAIGGTFGTLMMLELPDIEDNMRLRAVAADERAQADAMRAQAEMQRQQAEAARRQAEAALEADRAARRRDAGQDGP
jgi:hypothetical protein